MQFTKIILSFIILCIFQTNGYAKTDQAIEPADKYKLIINEKEFPIELNKYLKLPDSKIILMIEPNKTFNYGGVHFKYPRYFTFEANVKKEYYKSWTLAGNDAKIMIQNYKIITDHKAMAKTLIKTWGKENCKQIQCEMKIPDRILHGTKIIVTIKTTKISQEIYSFNSSDGSDGSDGSKLMIIQDTISDTGANSAEYISIKKQFEKLFKFN